MTRVFDSGPKATAYFGEGAPTAHEYYSQRKKWTPITAESCRPESNPGLGKSAFASARENFVGKLILLKNAK